MASDEPDVEDDMIVTCWCGASGRYDELFAGDLDETCAGTGTLNCYCGGDQCVCHHHGSTECPGCEDCDDERDDFYADDDL